MRTKGITFAVPPHFTMITRCTHHWQSSGFRCNGLSRVVLLKPEWHFLRHKNLATFSGICL